ncbi:hypothetical protein H5410_050848 [Solanum commersonii]|uniref:Putative plant transposon protein domain-containing protein n=1 Tax=Solanum commersonii TaxID=4109 RepID=A0A9J5WYA3_SOLCO|nr:hypothetical protein H5410_050848 [Solanum commersonii]
MLGAPDAPILPRSSARGSGSMPNLPGREKGSSDLVDGATSSEPIPVPPNDAPTPVAGEPNRWCVEGQWQIYQDAKMCDWMARDRGRLREIVRGVLCFLCDPLRGSISSGEALAQDPLTSTLVRGCPVDISPTTIRRFLYGPTADGERVEWVAAPHLGIRKATLTFVAKFFWLLVRNRVSPTKADNQVMWDRAVIVAALVAGVEIDFARMLLAEIHERAFRTSTTYPFPCLIFQLCRDSGVPIWHCDRLVHPTGALDIGLIRDEANVAAPRREPQVEADIASLRSDVEAILATPSAEPQVAPTALADDIVLDALFSGTAEEGLALT